MTPTEIANRLRALSAEMVDLGVDMNYFGGFAEIATHGASLIRSGKAAKSLANWIDAEYAVPAVRVDLNTERAKT